MARRIDIELTSARPDGTWTWRAAGALKPRGVVEGSLLYEGAKTGDVVRADAEFEIEGITIVGVLPPKERKRAEPERLEIIGPPREPPPGVTSSLTSRPDRGRDRADGPGRGARRGGEGGPRRPDDRPGRGSGERSGDRPPGERSGGRPASGDRPAAGDRPPPRADRAGADRAGAGARRDRPSRPDGAREGTSGARPGRPPRRSNADRSGGDRAEGVAAGEESRSKSRRLNPAGTHRTAVLEALPPEHRPIAEQVLRGGIPAVRTALHLEREKATAEGRPAPNSEALLAIAEELLPRLKAAEWRDRAEAAVKVADELALRDLRSVVAGADVARDDESRQLAASLREALDRRVDAQRQEWLDEVTLNLDEGRVVRALRVSSRPPDPGSRFPAELATRLATVAGEAMAPDTPPERWAALLEAVAASPVRRSVKPVGLPPEPGEALLHAARQSSGRIPALAAMLGISMPPPPGPVRPRPTPPRPTGRPGGPARPGASQRPARSLPPAPTPRATPAPEPSAGAVEPVAVAVETEPVAVTVETEPVAVTVEPEPQLAAPAVEREPAAVEPEPVEPLTPAGSTNGTIDGQVPGPAPAGPPGSS